MNINEYFDLTKKIFKENDVELTDSLIYLSAYQYLKFPAISRYHSDIKIFKGLRTKTPVVAISNEDNDYLLRVLDIDMDGLGIGFSQYSKPNAFRVYIKDEDKEIAHILNEKIQSSNNFKELSDSLVKFKYSSLKDRISLKNKNLLYLASMYGEYSKIDESLGFKQSLYDNLMSCLSLFYKANAGRTSSLSAGFNNFLHKDLEPKTKVSIIEEMMTYDNLKLNVRTFDDIPVDEKLNLLIEITKDESMKNTVVHSMIHSSQPFEDIIDNIIFNEFKRSIATELKLVQKESTLETVYEKYPILAIVKEEALKIDPLLNSNLSDRFKHKRITSDDVFINGKLPECIADKPIVADKISLLDVFDEAKIYQGNDAIAYLGKKFTFDDESSLPKTIPYDFTKLKPNGFDVRYGSDGYSMYYSIFSKVEPFTMDNDALYINSALIHKDVPEEIVQEAFENIFLECLEKKTPIIFESINVKGQLGPHFDVLLDIKEKYKELVPAFISIGDSVKVKMLTGKDVSFEQVVEFENLVDELLEKGNRISEIKPELENKILKMEEKHKTSLKNKNSI